MGSISFTQITDGSTIDATDVNTPLNTIYNDYNGNIDSNNLADNAVTTDKITDANVTMSKISNPYKARAYSTSVQTINDASITKVTLGTEAFDPNSNFTSSEYTVPVTGYYQINAIFQATDTTGKLATVVAYIYKGGSTLVAQSSTPATSANTMYSCPITLAGLFYLKANDVINLYVNGDTIDSGTFTVSGNLSIFLASV